VADHVPGSADRWPGGAVPSFSHPGLLGALEGAPAEALDDLPFGLITMDRRGVVLHYNADESRRSGLAPERVVGRDFFTSVGPCADHPLVGGRFTRAAETGGTLDEELDFTFTFRMRLSPVRLRLLAAAGSPQQNLAVRDP
jgi:photoactive yellow protein